MLVHVLRNASIPIITNLMAGLPGLLLGSFLIERFFSIPGIGREVTLAVERSDFPVIKAITVYVAFATIATNLLADLTYKAVDPRVQRLAGQLLQGVVDAERQRKQHRREHAGDGEQHRVRQPLEDARRDGGLALGVRALMAQGAVDDVREERQELLGHRLVEAHALLDLLPLLDGRFTAGEVIDRIARHHVQEQKRQDRDAQNRERAGGEAPQQEHADRHARSVSD